MRALRHVCRKPWRDRTNLYEFGLGVKNGQKLPALMVSKLQDAAVSNKRISPSGIHRLQADRAHYLRMAVSGAIHEPRRTRVNPCDPYFPYVPHLFTIRDKYFA